MKLEKLAAKDDKYKLISNMLKNKAMQCQCGYKGKIVLPRKRFIDSEGDKGYVVIKCKECKIEMGLEFNFEYESVRRVREGLLDGLI